MSLPSGPVVLAHPLTQRHDLPVSPLLMASLAVVILVVVAYAAWRAAPDRTEPTDQPREEPNGPWLLATRLLGLGILVLAVVAGMVGSESNLRNITTALVIGVGWPLLVLASAAAGRVWQWVDPYDSLARVAAPLGAGDGEADADAPVWAAVVTALLLVAYLTMWPNNLAPRSVASALIVYTVAMLAGCLAVGRRQWLARAEIFGLFSSWIAAARHPSRWQAQPGAHAVLAVLAGGLTFGLLRDSELLLAIGFGPNATRYSGLALAGAVAVTAALAHAAVRRDSQRGAAPAVSLALTIAAAGLAVALALARNRFTTSVQLLPHLFRDPLGTGVDPLASGPAINARPLGVAGLLALQLAVLVGAHVAAAVAASRRAPRATVGGGTPPALLLLGALLGTSVAAVSATAVGS